MQHCQSTTDSLSRGFITGMEWVAISISRREEIINCFINIFNQMDNNCFPFGHNTRTDTAGCQVTLYICIYCVNGWMSYIYIDTSLHVLVRSIELYTFPCYRCKSVALQEKLGWHAEQVCQPEFAAELQVCSYYMGRQWMNVVCNSVLLQYLNYQGFNSVALRKKWGLHAVHVFF